MANFTGEENYTSKVNQTLSAPTAGRVEFLSALTTLNIFLSITAAVGNALIIISLKNVSSIHPPTKLFFRCLAATDFCVGLIVQPVYAAFLIPQRINRTVVYCLYKFYSVSSYTLCGVTVLTSTAISVDRLLALLLGMRYRHVVTLRRVRVVITCFWLIAASLGLLSVWRQEYIARKVASAALILCLLTAIFCYTKIHLKLRHQQSLLQNNVPHGQQNGGGIPLNIAKYKKTISSIMWVQFALVVCYAPWCIAAVLGAHGIYNYVAWRATETLGYLNSSLNPILYCWKIKEVKQAVKGTIRHLNCFQKTNSE